MTFRKLTPGHLCLAVALLATLGVTLIAAQTLQTEPLRSQVTQVAGFKGDTLVLRIELPKALPTKVMVVDPASGMPLATVYDGVEQVVEVALPLDKLPNGKYFLMFETQGVVASAYVFVVQRTQAKAQAIYVDTPGITSGRSGAAVPLSGGLGATSAPDGGPALGSSPL